ncbi:hypothetical protein [Nocardioides campestrisoli]|uniref:hypothetical protein n=1 Tax=Nocardioides campestrisoli TaxID=2736757 RepID=UPI0015E68BA2|nr:hypothetical protein [Nocardioides campestrisoli]
MSTRPLHYNPRMIRRVLSDAAESTPYAAARRAGVDPKTAYRWAAIRAADPSWPSDALIDEWEADQVEKAAARRAAAAQTREYRKRVYLQRGPMLIDSIGTVRRLQALCALGWTGPQLGARLGVTPARVGHLVSGRWTQVHRDTAAKVAALYDELSMTVPQDPKVLRPTQIRIHARQRRLAAAKGWAPPLAWDDIDRDRAPVGFVTPAGIDETVVDRLLAGDQVTHTPAERWEAIRRWDGSDNALERMHGWNVARDRRQMRDHEANNESEVA